MADVHLLRPEWLLVLPAGLAALWLAWRRQDRSRGWRDQVDARLLPYLMSGTPLSPARGALLLAGLCLALASLALAGPSWQRNVQQSYRSLTARMLVLDVSRSMDATDLAPSRLHRARRKLDAILDRPFDGQLGLVVFAGDAFTVSPLTDDAVTLRNMLPALDTQVVPVQGGRADRGLALAARLLADGGAEAGQVLLLTDGVVLGPARQEARALRARGYRVSVLGLGTPRGAPVPLAGGRLLTDARGSVVLPALDEAALAEVARAGGGVYVRHTLDDGDLERLLAAPAGGDGGTEAVDRRTSQWHDQGYLLLPPLLLLAALGFRRGWVLPLSLLALVVPAAPDATAADLAGWFRRPDQRAAAALGAGDPQAALAADAGPAWNGAAHYRAGDYGSAARTYGGLDSADGHYNRGNALALDGRLREALRAYDLALAKDPTLPDARHNRELVRRALEQQRQRRQPQQRPARDAVQANENGGATEGAGADRRQAAPHEAAPRDPAPEAPGAATAARREASASRPAQAIRDLEDGRAGAPLAHGAAPDAQEMERWLRRIPDDPGGLLRRKFAAQHKARRRWLRAEEQQW